MTRRLDAFITIDEWTPWADAFSRDAGVRVFEGETRAWRSIATIAVASQASRRAQLLFVPREHFTDEVALIARTSIPEDSVVMLPPRLEGDVLLMTSATTLKFGPDELMTRMARSLLKQAKIRTWYRGISGGEARPARGVRCTRGAVEWYARGGKLRQEAVANVVFVPDGHL